MGCDKTRAKSSSTPIYLRAHDPVKGRRPEIAWVDWPSRRVYARVRYEKHRMEKCDAWTFDAETWRLDVEPKFAIFHVHRIPDKGPPRNPMQGDHTYRIAVSRFSSLSHSSFDCTDLDRKHPEKLHCPRACFDNPDDPCPPPIGPLQPALPL